MSGAHILLEITRAASEAKEKGLTDYDLIVTVTRPVYEAINSPMNSVHYWYSWDDFCRAYEMGMTRPTICGMEARPAPWGDGWTITKRRKISVKVNLGTVTKKSVL